MGNVSAPHQHTDATPFSAVDAMTILLTVESLLLASLSIALVLFASSGLPVRATSAARALLISLTVLIALVAIGAGVAWGNEFLDSWPSTLNQVIPIVCIAIGIASQPFIAAAVTWLTSRKMKVEVA